MGKLLTMYPRVEFQFDELKHAYLVGTKSIPSVTEVLKSVGLTPDMGPDIAPVRRNIKRAAQRGDNVHLATQMIDSGDLDWSSLTPKETSYVLAYERFQKKEGFIAKLAEYPLVVMTELGPYGMKLDRFGQITKGDNAGWWVLDFKCTAKPAPSWEYQTAAYMYGLLTVEQEMMMAMTGQQQVRRGVLWLKPDGNYKLIPHGYADALTVFFHALAVHHAKLRDQGVGFDEMFAKYLDHKRAKGNGNPGNGLQGDAS